MPCNRLLVVGVGLIGGSLARALKRAGFCAEVCAYDQDAGALAEAQRLGVVDSFESDLSTAVAKSDIVVLAAPIGAFDSLLPVVGAALSPKAILTDVGSVKGPIVELARRTLGLHLPRFVPGHPIAGTERNGVAASFAGLFEQRRVVLTPLPETDPGALQQVRAMWEATGGLVEDMGVAEHDEVFAVTSHLPHALAFGLVEMLAGMPESREIFRYAAGGFADFTRIASSSPRIWHDIFMANAGPVLAALASYEARLDELKAAIDTRDSARLMRFLERAKQARDRYTRAGPGREPSS